MKVVKQQGKFGAVDDDESMGSNVNSKWKNWNSNSMFREKKTERSLDETA